MALYNKIPKTPQDLIGLLCVEFSLGTFRGFHIGDEGILNKKYRITTDLGSFFIKVIKGKTEERLAYIYGVEGYMKSQGISAVTMMMAKNGKPWVKIGATLFCAYPFIDSDRSRKYSLTEYEAMGALLARMHWAGQSGTRKAPEFLLTALGEKVSKKDGLKMLEKNRSILAKKPNPDENDKKILDYLDYKILLAQTVEDGSTNVRDTVIHADFHPGNILFEKTLDNKVVARPIIGVCDWELAKFGSRASDLVHSLLYSCFLCGLSFEKKLSNAKAMLVGYTSVFPISYPELEQGFMAHIYSTTFSVWTETRYYKYGDKEAVEKMAFEREMTQYCVNNLILPNIF